jgi:spermidine synthase
MSNPKNNTRIVLLSAFVAGFAFLVFEINLFRALSNLFGATVVASTMVLSVFMGGYGFGSLFFGNSATRSPNLMTLFSKILGLVGAGGIASYIFINNLLPGFYGFLFSVGFGSFPAKTVVYFLAIVVLFIPSFMMGGILPVATKLVAQKRADISKTIGFVYALDTLGSAIGGLITGFILNRYLGQFQSVLISGALMTITAFLVYKFSVDWKPTALESFTQKALASTSDRKSKIIILLSATLFGFGMNALQVLLIRVFKIYLINTIYSFALITSVVILGLFAGSYIYKSVSKKREFSLSFLLIFLTLFGFLAVANIFVVEKIPSLIMFPLGEIINNQLFRMLGIPFIASFITVLPLAVVSGFAFPLACTLNSNNIETVGRSVGMVIMFNTIGAVIGPLLAAFLLIPVFGILKGMLVVAGLTVLSALIFRFMSAAPPFFKINVTAGIVGLMVIVGIAFSKREAYILPPSFIKSNRNIVAYKENIEGSYVVGEEIVGRNRILTTYVNNSAVIGTSYDAIKVVKMVGHLPFMLGLECQDALVVGFGIGVTTAAIGIHQGVKNIDCVELVSNLTDVAHYYTDINNNIHLDKRLRFIEDDGRHFLQTTNKKYGLISSDPTHPILGSGSLYTREYFELCRNRLTDNGMVSQYLPLHKLSLSDFLGIIKTFHSVFPHSTVWLGHFHAVLIGSKQPLTIDFSQWINNMSSAANDKLFYNNPFHLAASLVLDGKAIEEVTARYRINTDNIAYTDYFSFESLREENIATNLKFLDENRGGFDRVFSNVPDSVLMLRYIKGNQYLTKGLVYMLLDDWKQLHQYLEKACMVNPENVEYPLLIEFYKRAEPSKTR